MPKERNNAERNLFQAAKEFAAKFMTLRRRTDGGRHVPNADEFTLPKPDKSFVDRHPQDKAGERLTAPGAVVEDDAPRIGNNAATPERTLPVKRPQSADDCSKTAAASNATPGTVPSVAADVRFPAHAGETLPSASAKAHRRPAPHSSQTEYEHSPAPAEEAFPSNVGERVREAPVPPSTWIKYNGSNAKKFQRTWPVSCTLAGSPLKGENWVRVLVNVVERELERNNPAMDALYRSPLFSTRSYRPFLMRERLEGVLCRQLSNGYWINVNFDIPHLMKMIWAICLRCGYAKEQIVLWGIPKGAAQNRKKVFVQKRPSDSAVTQHDGLKDTSFDSARSTERQDATVNGLGEHAKDTIDGFIRSAGLQGATVAELIEHILPGATAKSVADALDADRDILAMPGKRYVHAESLVGLEEAEETLRRILKAHFSDLGGYSNAALLYEGAVHELSMFLNDNDCGNEDTVYAIARFLFEKRAAAEAPYCFSAPHIFETEPDHPATIPGLMIRLARANDGLLCAAVAADFLNKARIACASLNQILRIGTSNTFLFCDADDGGRYLLSEALGIDGEWCARMHDRLDDLFRTANVAYVIPRDISAAWLASLPKLPHGLAWTHLLLQEVLKKFSDVGFRPISPSLSQSFSTLAAAFVPSDSPLQTFADVVTLLLEERHGDLPKYMSAVELHADLRHAGMVQNTELLMVLPKALKDPRFAWSDGGKKVYVRGNR